MQFDPVIIPLKQSSNPGHAIGSAMTYARRYSLSAALGIATEEDNDGNTPDQDRTRREYSPQQKSTTYYSNQQNPKYGNSNIYSFETHNKENVVEKEEESVEKIGLSCKQAHIQLMIAFKGIHDKKRRAIIWLFCGKDSSKDMTEAEMRKLTALMRQYTEDEINRLVRKACEMKIRDIETNTEGAVI